MSEKITDRFYRGPYIKRPDEVAPVAADILSGPSDNELPTAEKIAAYNFENNLFDYELEGGKSIGEVLRERQEDESISPKFFLAYFKQDPKGRAWVTEKLGIDPQALSEEEGSAW